MNIVSAWPRDGRMLPGAWYLHPRFPHRWVPGPPIDPPPRAQHSGQRDTSGVWHGVPVLRDVVV